MPIGLQRGHQALGISERRQFENAIQPGEQVTTFTECATKYGPPGINQVEPEAHRRAYLFKRYNDTYLAGGANGY